MIVVKWQINTLSETGNAKNVVKLALNARYQVESQQPYNHGKKYLRQTLVFMCNSALFENFQF